MNKHLPSCSHQPVCLAAAGQFIRRYVGLLLLLAASVAVAENLYQAESFRPLTADIKAYQIGDALTVQVLENSSASTSADTGTRRNNSLSAQWLTPGSSSQSRQAGLDVKGDFDGGGRTQRSNRLLATLTVTVREVLADGQLRVAGEQRLTVNEEPQRVALEGRVRPQDISDGNIVLSTRLADARITYVGEGDLAERNRRSWWRKLLDWSGL
ncbi:MAG: flagellar basal body L-ring protein FlgH [Janthinobacterium lividum]